MSKQIKGILGTKLGMTQVFNDAGQIVPVTVVQAGPCVVTAVRTPDRDGYSAVQLGFGEIDPRKVTKPAAGHFAKAVVGEMVRASAVVFKDGHDRLTGRVLLFAGKRKVPESVGVLTALAQPGDVEDDLVAVVARSY